MSRISDKRSVIRAVFEPLRQNGQLPRLPVGHIMTPNPTCVSRDKTVYELVKMVHANCFRHLLVVDGQELVGVISDRDMILCFDFHKPPSNEHLKTIRASELMSTDLVTVRPDSPLIEAIALMLDCGINCLPVVAGRKPVGIVTSTDLFLTFEQLLRSIAGLDPAGATSNADTAARRR